MQLVYDAYSSPLTAATNVQLRLLRINTPPPGVDFGDELQHYAIYDFEVLGTCSCTQTVRAIDKQCYVRYNDIPMA